MTEIQKVRQKIDELADILQSMPQGDPAYYDVSRDFEKLLKELRWLEARPEEAYKDDDWSGTNETQHQNKR